ncbi:hypothetical protein COE80_07315 [Bacillus pseudomycoides]|uniref:hypothetical protein n=1 Tax=Bacillus pseudomycoides TaxID=64104 RepID=UPI000BFD90FF|nr:hypothetical protein [Bacillus pseudomycoides]PHB30437.1 hypothetical protein COE80_07315 [Bacillus pseudomycoides]
MKLDLRLQLVEPSIRKELQYILLSAQINKIHITKLAESIGIDRKKLYRVLRGETSYRQATSVTFNLLKEFPPITQPQLESISTAIDEIHEKINCLGGDSNE